MADPRDNGSIKTGVGLTVFYLISIAIAFGAGYKVRDDGNRWRSPFTQQLTRKQIKDRLYPSPGSKPY